MIRKTTFAATAFAGVLGLGLFGPAMAEQTIKIGLSTDEFVLEETDFSHLEVGDSEIITTDSGKELEITRTEDGFEFAVDGEKFDMFNFNFDAGFSGLHTFRKQIGCSAELLDDEEAESDCDVQVWMDDEFGAIDIDQYLHSDGDVRVIAHKVIEHESCDDDQCQHGIKIIESVDGEVIELDGSEIDLDDLDAHGLDLHEDRNIIVIRKHAYSNGEEI